MNPPRPAPTPETETNPAPADIALRRAAARWVLLAFIVTFLCARCVVFLIMARRLPDLFLYVNGTHVHHLNYGIFLLAAAGGWLLFRPPTVKRWPALIYGIGLALTFDEFGMWLHLGGGYWQRASWDAVVVVAAVLAFFAFGPTISQYRSQQWLLAFTIFAATLWFLWMLAKSLDHAGRQVLPKLQYLDQNAPP